MKVKKGKDKEYWFPEVKSCSYEIIEEVDYGFGDLRFPKDFIAVAGVIHLLANRFGRIREKRLYMECSKFGIGKNEVSKNIRKLIEQDKVSRIANGVLQLVGQYDNSLREPSDGKELITIKRTRKIGKRKLAVRTVIYEDVVSYKELYKEFVKQFEGKR